MSDDNTDNSVIDMEESLQFTGDATPIPLRIILQNSIVMYVTSLLIHQQHTSQCAMIAG